MKRIGLLGGMSWESSAEYYRLINLLVGASTTRRCRCSTPPGFTHERAVDLALDATVAPTHSDV